MERYLDKINIGTILLLLIEMAMKKYLGNLPIFQRIFLEKINLLKMWLLEIPRNLRRYSPAKKLHCRKTSWRRRL